MGVRLRPPRRRLNLRTAGDSTVRPDRRACRPQMKSWSPARWGAISTASTSSSCAGSGRSMPWRTGSSAREEDARDVAQETFLRAFRALKGFKGQAKFSSWLYRITLNLCRDWIRRERRTPVAQAPEGVDIIELAGEVTPSESDRGARLAARGRPRGGEGHVAAARGAADGHHPEGISRAHVPGDRRSPRLSVEYGEDPFVPGAHGPAKAAARGRCGEHLWKMTGA